MFTDSCTALEKRTAVQGTRALQEFWLARRWLHCLFAPSWPGICIQGTAVLLSSSSCDYIAYLDALECHRSSWLMQGQRGEEVGTEHARVDRSVESSSLGGHYRLTNRQAWWR